MNAKIFHGCKIATLFFIAAFQSLNAQKLSESGKVLSNQPLDGIYTTDIHERTDLKNPHLIERDVLWEKRIWREIDIKELRNQHFANEKRPLINILLEAAEKGDVTAYNPIDDQFTKCMTNEEIKSVIHQRDTIFITDIETDVEKPVEVFNDFDPKSVIRYRIKEVAYYDSKTSKYQSKILGIAPIMQNFDNDGNLISTAPICWFYYNDIRPVLAKEGSFSNQTDSKDMSWDDIFESRLFSSFITKESNVNDERLQDKYAGINIIIESQKIQEDIRNRVEDLNSNH
jgi:gliding motility associated protien GldN